MISFADIVIGHGHGVACQSCSPMPSESHGFVSVAETLESVRAVCGAWDAGPGPNVALIGAEPFSHPELPTLVSGAVEAGAVRIRLRTDGGALSAPGNALGAIAAGVRHLEVVLLGGDAATHDGLARRPGLFADAIAGMSAFADAGAKQRVPVALAGLVPVCRHNLDRVPGAVGALARAGVVTVTLDVSAEAAASIGAQRWLAAAVETGTVNGVWVSVRGMADAAVPVSALHAIVPVVHLGAAG